MAECSLDLGLGGRAWQSHPIFIAAIAGFIRPPLPADLNTIWVKKF
jgi:hypothetical protein